jgi:type IV pilus assembly protein PilQ
MMRMGWRGTATAILAAGLLALAGCASRGPAATTAAAGTAGRTAATSPAEPAAATARITQAGFEEDSDGARLVLSADAPLLYTAYEPRPDLLVIDLPGISLADGFAAPAASGTLVSSVRIEPLSELGKSITRLTVSHREGARFDVRSVGQGLAVAFEAPKTASAAVEAPAEVPAVAAPPPAAPSVAVARASASPDLAPARGENAHALEEVRAIPGAGQVTVALLADGMLTPRDFVLDNPPRVVIDLPGVKNELRRRVTAVKSPLVSRIRVSQFQSAPDLTTRVVIDLARPMPHAIVRDGEKISIVVGGEAASAAAPPEPAPVPAAAPSRTTVAAVPDHPAPSAAEPPVARKAETVAGKPVGKTPEPPPPAAVASTEKPAPRAAEPAPAVAASTTSSSAALPETRPVVEKPVAVAAAAPPRATLPKQARRNSREPKGTPREEALFEAAAAVLQQEEGARPETAAPPASSYQPRTISESQGQFTGEPISLDLKDADIKDVFRTISQLTQLNIVVDPEVRGTVTVQLEDVPWDQALDLILKQNGLGYVLENNIMRIATTQKLQAEQADRARLAEARQAAEPTRTVIKKLSYARAGEILPSLKSVMSKRGDIVVDGRTNTLIIREIPTYLPAVMQLIENLDTATPQVMIESRIVETTKSLGRNLGINWGTSGVADVAHGNTTNLVFPNNFTSAFNVGLQNGPTVASVRLGNILNTFSLDVALTAAENQGLLKIISSPKVAALTNTSASIQSGVQIPVQTTVNNTTTVIYVDATLKLTVTPQITNEGTILLDVNVSKREPAVALNLSLGQNVPLTVREYRGQILVRDGGTTVIGGIFQINDQDQNNMIPGLWKIPIFGNLFRNKTRTEKHDELLIFITPRILRS